MIGLAALVLFLGGMLAGAFARGRTLATSDRLVEQGRRRWDVRGVVDADERRLAPSLTRQYAAGRYEQARASRIRTSPSAVLDDLRTARELDPDSTATLSVCT